MYTFWYLGYICSHVLKYSWMFYMCVWMWVCLRCVPMHVCGVHLQTPKKDILCPLYHTPSYFLKRGSFTESGADRKSQWSSYLCLQELWGYRRVHNHTWLHKWALGIKFMSSITSQALLLAKPFPHLQMFCILSENLAQICLQKSLLQAYYLFWIYP